MKQRRTSQRATPNGHARRSMALGKDDPRARREADARMNGGQLASDGTISFDAATGRMTVNIEEVRKRLAQEE